MKRGKKLLWLLLVLAVLIGATAAASLLEPESGEEDTSTTVFSLDPDSVTELGWEYSEEILFTASEAGWVCAQDEAFPVDVSFLDAMLETLTEVRSSKTIEGAEDLDQYGLEVPVCVVTVTTDETYTLAIGLETSVGGERYFSTGDGNVYLVDSGIIDSFRYGLYDVLQHQTVPEVEALTGMTVALDSGGYEITRLEDSGLAYSDEYVWFMGDKALDTELTESLIAMVTNLNLSQCVDYDADDLSVYGLDEPAAIVTILDGGEAAFTLEIGDAADDVCYIRLGGSKMIYQVDAELRDTILYTTYADLLPDEVLLMDWDTVESVTVTLDGEEYKLVKSIEEVSDDEGNTTEETVWKLNGEEAEFASVLTSLTAMDSNGYGTGITPECSAEISFRITRDQNEDVELTFYQYNSTSCLVTLNGESTVTVAREDVVELVEAVNGIVLG